GAARQVAGSTCVAATPEPRPPTIRVPRLQKSFALLRHALAVSEGWSVIYNRHRNTHFPLSDTAMTHHTTFATALLGVLAACTGPSRADDAGMVYPIDVVAAEDGTLYVAD